MFFSSIKLPAQVIYGNLKSEQTMQVKYRSQQQCYPSVQPTLCRDHKQQESRLQCFETLNPVTDILRAFSTKWKWLAYPLAID